MQVAKINNYIASKNMHNIIDGPVCEEYSVLGEH